MAETGLLQFRNIFSRFTRAQRAGLIAVAAVSLILIIVLTTVLNAPSYGTLFNNLNTQDASKIVQKLKEKNIPYQLDDNGKTILVPKKQMYDLRLELAGEGLPQNSVIGYEIFDRTNLGISDFVQKVNYRRAMEGELARTILQLEEVEGARVHIVVPERALFKEDEKPATASVVLKLKSGKPLRNDVIQGITHLVASSVEGLEADKVSILDSRGNLLSENTERNGIAAMTSTQYELQQKVESYLSQKAQRILESAVGMGNAIVQINAELDFRQVERNLEQYDPESAVARSEQTTEEKTVMSDSVQPSTRSNSVTNYELNKTVEHIVEAMGSVKRLSVATMVNAIPKIVEKDGLQTTEFIQRKPEEVQQFEEIVKRAVGFSTERNDEITVVSMPFGKGIHEEQMLYKDSPLSNWSDWLQKIAIIAAMLAAVLLIRSILNKIRVQTYFPGEVYEETENLALAGAGETGKLHPRKSHFHLPSPEEEISTEALLKAEKRKRIVEYVKDKPDDAARLLKVWLAEEI